MPLPELIEIVPLKDSVKAQITVPGSKSITNRALVLAALADGEVILEGALWSEDTQIMVESLQEMGFMVNLAPDPEEICNRTITVYGQGGEVPPGGSEQQPMDLFVGNAGTAARFLAALVCLGKGVYRLAGSPRMHERPQAALFQALRGLGYRVEAERGNDRLPAKIFGQALKQGPTLRSGRVSIEESSQFASALLLCANAGGWQIEVTGENAEESPYVAMTSKLIEVFPHRGGTFRIEPDASSGTYFLAAAKMAQTPEYLEYSEQFDVDVLTTILNRVAVVGWPDTGWQVDERFEEFIVFGSRLHQMLELEREGLSRQQILARLGKMPTAPEISRKTDLGDSIMMAIVLSAAGAQSFRFTDLGRLRVQECERVAALRTELTRCGAKVVEDGDTLSVDPSTLHGADIETYNDHRMAMCFAILGLKVPGIRIKNPGCVKKTFPNFFQKLAGAPPKGLGAMILEPGSGRTLEFAELFAL